MWEWIGDDGATTFSYRGEPMSAVDVVIPADPEAVFKAIGTPCRRVHERGG